MREILFRGKRRDNGEWIEGFIGGLHCFKTDDETGEIRRYVMTTKEWLWRGRNIRAEIVTLIDARKTAFEVATSATVGAGERVQTTPRNTSEDKFIKYVELSEKIDAKIIELLQIQPIIMSAISEVKDGVDRAILIDYYINGLTLEQIAVKQNYSYKQICRRHGNALLQVRCP